MDPHAPIAPHPPRHPMTGREAAECLAALGIERESARRALAAGVAGAGVRTRAAVLYDRARVESLVDRAQVPLDHRDVDDLPAACRGGTLVVRLSPRRPDDGSSRSWQGADTTAPREEQWDAARMWFRMSPWTRVLLRSRASTGRPAPFVATVGGFVVLGADVLGVDVEARGTSLRLGEPGDWFECWREGRFEGGARSRWQWWIPGEDHVRTTIGG